MAEPAVTIAAYHRSRGNNLPASRVVIHATCPPDVPYPAASAAGQAHATAQYFTEPSAGGSAHYVEDVAGEEHCVADEVIGWHAPPNAHSVGIEICGLSTYPREQWLSPQVWPAVQRAIDRTRELCDRLDIPFVRIGVDELRANRKGVCGHVDVANAWHQSNHTDPGPGFPWDEFMGVGHQQEQLAPQPAPIPAPGDDDMPRSILDPTVQPDASGRLPNWAVDRDGNIYCWDGARQLKSLSALVSSHPPIEDVAPHWSGDGVVLFGADGRFENGEWARSTYTILVGM